LRSRERLDLPTTPRARDAHLDELDRWCALDGEGADSAADLISLTGDILLHTAASEVGHGADDLRRWMKRAFDRDVRVHRADAATGRVPADGGAAVHVTILGSFPSELEGVVAEETLSEFRERADRPGSFMTVATTAGVVILGKDAMGARYGLARLIELMTDTGVPAVPRDLGVRRPSVSPRIMSGVSLGRGGRTASDSATPISIS
jgi:hypothetical protein